MSNQEYIECSGLPGWLDKSEESTVPDFIDFNRAPTSKEELEQPYPPDMEEYGPELAGDY